MGQLTDMKQRTKEVSEERLEPKLTVKLLKLWKVPEEPTTPRGDDW